MKIIHLPAYSKAEVKIPSEIAKRLPKGLGVVTTIQHMKSAKNVALEIGGVFVGQVLGCKNMKAVNLKEDVSGFLFIGSGKFHPLAVALNTGKTVYCFDPLSSKLSQIGQEEVEMIQKKKQAGVMKYLASENIGILVSTKSGQNNAIRAEKFIKEHSGSAKKHYLFAFETLDIAWLDHFPFIECWVNTACPRMIEDLEGMANLEDIEAALKEQTP